MGNVKPEKFFLALSPDRNHMGPTGTMKWTDGRCYEGQFRDGLPGTFVAIAAIGGIARSCNLCSGVWRYRGHSDARQEAWRRQTFLA